MSPRLLLFCAALALPTMAAAASCDILPYANQCQGSNYWPTGSGWVSPHSSSTCQPSPGSIAAVLGWTCSYGFAPTFVERSELEAWLWDYFPDGVLPIAAGVNAYGQNSNYSPCYDVTYNGGTYGGWADNRWLTGNCGSFLWPNGFCASVHKPICPPGSGSLNTSSVNNGSALLFNGEYWSCTVNSKLPNGVCTARWTSSAQAALQKDPLDPDCDANSCVFDGTCRLR